MAEAAIASGGLSALGAVSGGMPSVGVSPSLQNTDSAAQVNIICCSRGANASNNFDNRRVVYRNGKLDDQGNDSCIKKLFKKLCCCCCGLKEVRAEENQEAIDMFEAYLVQQYGRTAAGVAPLYAGIDLTGKKRSGETLRVREFRVLDSAAQEVREQEPELKKMARFLKFYDRQQHLESCETPRSSRKECSVRTKERIKLSVRHADGRKERFKAKRMRECIRDLPTSEEIPECEIKAIVSQVSEELRAQGVAQATTEEIRDLVTQELSHRGYEILPPTEHLNSPLLESVRGKSSANIDPELCLTLLNAMKQQSSSSRSFVRAEDSSSSD